MQLDNIQSSDRVEAPTESGVPNIQTKLPASTNASKGAEETPITGVPEFNLVMRDQPEDQEYWARQSGGKMKLGESADEFFSRTVLNPIHSSMFGSQAPQLSREELSDFGLDKAQKESIIATAGGNPKDYTDEDVYRATYPIDETKFSMSRANVMEASENEADYNMNYNMAIQQELVDAGYDLGNTGDNMDGVDGIMGSKTRAAADEFQFKKNIGNVDAVPSQFGGMKSLKIDKGSDLVSQIGEQLQKDEGYSSNLTMNIPSNTSGLTIGGIDIGTSGGAEGFAMLKEVYKDNKAAMVELNKMESSGLVGKTGSEAKSIFDSAGIDKSAFADDGLRAKAQYEFAAKHKIPAIKKRIGGEENWNKLPTEVQSSITSLSFLNIGKNSLAALGKALDSNSSEDWDKALSQYKNYWNKQSKHNRDRSDRVYNALKSWRDSQ